MKITKELRNKKNILLKRSMYLNSLKFVDNLKFENVMQISKEQDDAYNRYIFYKKMIIALEKQK